LREVLRGVFDADLFFAVPPRFAALPADLREPAFFFAGT
jgi:hypothetical protein